jgi:hypothetical protein
MNLNNISLKVVIVSLSKLFLLSGCSTYSSKFTCDPATGLGCTMMRLIDKKIDSGEADKIYKKNCKGKVCKNDLSEIVIPQSAPIKVKLTEPTELDEVIVEDETNKGDL